MKSPIQGYPIKIPTSMIQRDKNPWNMVLNGESFPTRPGIGGEFFAINFEDKWTPIGLYDYTYEEAGSFPQILLSNSSVQVENVIWKNYKAISGYPGPKEVPNKEVNNEEE